MMRAAALIVAALLCIALFPVRADAYFNRGTVQISVGKSSVSIASGSTASVSVQVSPIKQDQLPGCGMAECPQTCGDGCLDANGECTCGGTEYHTYYSSVSAASSNSSVATASYSNGTLTIKAVSPGTATINLTGSMRQYTDGTAAVNVTVTSQSTKSGTASGGTSSGTQSSSSGTAANAADGTSSGVIVENQGNAGADAATAQGTEAQADADAETSPEGEVIDTEKGKYRIVDISSSTDIEACFKDAAAEGSHLVFQQKNGDNIEYSWTFDGTKLDQDFDYSKIKLDITGSSDYPDSFNSALKGINAYYMKFSYSGDLPAPADIYINVTQSFASDEELHLYQAISTSGRLKEQDGTAQMTNGYASFTIDHCSSYMLTDQKIAGAEKAVSSSSATNSPLNGPLIAVIAAAMAAAALFIFFLMRSLKRR